MHNESAMWHTLLSFVLLGDMLLMCILSCTFPVDRGGDCVIPHMYPFVFWAKLHKIASSTAVIPWSRNSINLVGLHSG